MSGHTNNVYQKYRFYVCEKPEEQSLQCERLGEPFCFWTGDESPQLLGVHKLIPECLDDGALHLKWSFNKAVSQVKKIMGEKR
jgi:hypothetical protein